MRAVAVLTLGAAVAAGAVVAAGASRDGREAAEVERRIVLVSGRDDHGLLVQRQVGLSRFPGGAPRAQVRDGTLVAVEAIHGEWLQVRALERSSARGWVNDYYLRGTAHLVRRAPGFAQNEQVELADVRPASVRVRSLRTRREAWVPRVAVAELPAG